MTRVIHLCPRRVGSHCTVDGTCSISILGSDHDGATSVLFRGFCDGFDNLTPRR